MRKLINRLLSTDTYIIFLAITGAYCIHVDKLPTAYLHLVIIMVVLNKKNAIDYAVAKQRYKLNKYFRHKLNKYFTKDESKDRHDGQAS